VKTVATPRGIATKRKTVATPRGIATKRTMISRRWLGNKRSTLNNPTEKAEEIGVMTISDQMINHNVGPQGLTMRNLQTDVTVVRILGVIKY
jgi:hypothetical protein